MYFKVNFFVIGVWCLVGVKGIVIILKEYIVVLRIVILIKVKIKRMCLNLYFDECKLEMIVEILFI